MRHADLRTTTAARNGAVARSHLEELGLRSHLKELGRPRRLLYHGGVPGLDVGALLVAPILSGQRNWHESRRDRVYLTPILQMARAFAAPYGDGDVYKVAPLGAIAPDPDCRAGSSWMPPVARIVGIVERAVPKKIDAAMIGPWE